MPMVAPMREMKALIVLSPKDFKDEEFRSVKLALEKESAKIHILCFSRQECFGEHGMSVAPNASLDSISPDEYDAIILVGGPGVLKYHLNEYLPLLNLVKSFDEAGKAIVGISEGIFIAIGANIVKEKKVAALNGEMAEMISKRRGIPINQNLVVSKNLITVTDQYVIKNIGSLIEELV